MPVQKLEEISPSQRYDGSRRIAGGLTDADGSVPGFGFSCLVGIMRVPHPISLGVLVLAC